MLSDLPRMWLGDHLGQDDLVLLELFLLLVLLLHGPGVSWLE